MRSVQALLIICLVIFTLALNVSRAVRADYNHDEDQFIASARLLLDKGLLPYRDYPYFHTPYLVFIYAPLFALAGNYNLLVARLFSALCASASVMLVFWMVFQFFKDHSTKVRFLAAFAVAFLYLPNPLLAATAGFSWNHNLSLLCLLGSLWLFLHASRGVYPGRWLLASGILLGVATGVRLSSITLLLAYLLALFWFPGGFSWKRCIRLGLILTAGVVLALLPLLWLFLLAPQQFIFGNIGYARLNSAYRLDVPVFYDGSLPVYGARSLVEKLDFLWNGVITQPANILLFVALIFFGWSILTHHLRHNSSHAFRDVLFIAAAPMIAVGAFLPTPTWYQYFCEALPFALLAIALGLSYLALDQHQARQWFLLMLLQLALISNLVGFQDIRRMSFLRHVHLWKPMVVHRVGADIRELVGQHGRVFTVAPLYPLEAGLQVYPPLVTGVFAFRTGSLLDETQRQQQGIISRENFEAYLQDAPPDAILVGFNQILEEPLIQYALRLGYTPHPLERGLTLWIK